MTHSCPLKHHGAQAVLTGHTPTSEQFRDARRLLLGLGGEGLLFFLQERDGSVAAGSHPFTTRNLTTGSPWRRSIRALNQSLKPENPHALQFQ